MRSYTLGGVGSPSQLPALWKIHMELAFSSCPSVAETNEKGVACSRPGKPRQDFGNIAALCLLKAMEVVVCRIMPGEDLY